MRRREFIGLVAGTATACLEPLAALAQRRGKPPVIGVMASTAESFRPVRELTVQRFGELDWIDGHNIVLGISLRGRKP